MHRDDVTAAAQRHRDARQHLDWTLFEAYYAGVRVAEIAQAAGVSREYLYRLLRDGQQDRQRSPDGPAADQVERMP